MGIWDWLSSKSKSESRQNLGSVFDENKKKLSRALAEVNTEKKISKVTDRVELRDFQVDGESLEKELVFFCPLRRAKIYCHSILVDKLGDLTKFIVVSLYKGHNVDEIIELTKMETSTINDEIDYLVRGGLMDDNRSSLTELGRQYGQLLESFEELSEGIDMDYNPVAEQFEPIVESLYVGKIDRKYVLRSCDFSVLARNKDFSNSREIALNRISEKMPFCDAIRSSLYTTVQISTGDAEYKCVRLRDFKKSDEEKDSCVRVAIPFDKISYTLSYSKIDAYRSKVGAIREIQEYPELLTKKAKSILDMVDEEEQCEPKTVGVNAVTGDVCLIRKDLVNLREIDKTLCYVLDGQEYRIKLCVEKSEGVYLSELERERLYSIRYFSYKRMEI